MIPIRLFSTCMASLPQPWMTSKLQLPGLSASLCSFLSQPSTCPDCLPHGSPATALLPHSCFKVHARRCTGGLTRSSSLRCSLFSAIQLVFNSTAKNHPHLRNEHPVRALDPLSAALILAGFILEVAVLCHCCGSPWGTFPSQGLRACSQHIFQGNKHTQRGRLAAPIRAALVSTSLYLVLAAKKDASICVDIGQRIWHGKTVIRDTAGGQRGHEAITY